MKLLRNRVLLGSLCIIVALLICFGLTPMLNAASGAQTEVLRARADIAKGQMVQAGMLETVTVGAYNLPDNVTKEMEAVVGQYATVDVKKGDYLLSSKITASQPMEFSYLADLNGSKQAMSITIKSFAAGLSAKLEAGDIVSLMATDFGDSKETYIPLELNYVRILAVTTGTGQDKRYDPNAGKEDEEAELPATLTVLVRPEQAAILAQMENSGKTHAILVYRGEHSQMFLDEQDRVIEAQLQAIAEAEAAAQQAAQEQAEREKAAEAAAEEKKKEDKK